MRKRTLSVAAAVLLLAVLLLVSCGKDREDTDAAQESWQWLTETSVEDPGAWFSVSVLPVD